MARAREVAKSLPVPTDVAADPDAVEMIRAWIADGALQCSLRIGAGEFAAPAAWGVLLADVARHVANAHHERDQAKVDVTISAIVEAFEDELARPSDEHEGEFTP